MNRTQLQHISDQRLDDARLLLASGHWSAAYYLAGYSLECALKSCVLAYVERTGIIFVEKKFAEKCWTHDIEILVQQADLKVRRDTLQQTNKSLATNWMIAKDWTETSRYRTASELNAKLLYNALSDVNNGVIPWLKSYW